jgi:hypothetical protein
LRKPFKPYRVMLYDSFDREWVEFGAIEQDDVNAALKFRDEQNLKQFGSTNPSHDHWGVLAMQTNTRGSEIRCPSSH